MITCMMKDGKMTLMCDGALLTLASETTALVREIYNAIKKDDAEAADAYKQMIKGAAKDDVMFDRNPIPIDELKSIIEKWEKDEESDSDDEEQDSDDDEYIRTRALRELGGATEE